MDIDVSKCEFIAKDFATKIYVCKNTENYDFCCNYKDCYYKQLQQLKAENEELKEKLENCNDEFGCEEMAKLKAENKELKEKLKHEEEMNVKIAKESVEVNGNLKQKLEKIKKLSLSAPICDSEYSLRILEIINEGDEE